MHLYQIIRDKGEKDLLFSQNGRYVRLDEETVPPHKRNSLNNPSSNLQNSNQHKETDKMITSYKKSD